MEKLVQYIQSRITLTQSDIDLIKASFIAEDIAANTQLLQAGKVEQYVYFLAQGVVKGYQNVDGKIVVQHLIAEHDFFASIDSFMRQTPSLDYFETITDCQLLKLSKTNFDLLQKEVKNWAILVKEITNEHLNCKLERIKDFQLLTAKERYLKFLDQYAHLALKVSIENIASFLGMEPQSLSRIRKQIAS